MSEVDRRRHARQLLLAEIGEQGQERLCAARLRIAAGADARAADVAREYLVRAGVQVIGATDARAENAVELAVAGEAAIRELAGAGLLDEAAAALAGAFAAVEAIKQALGLAQPPAELPPGLALASEVGS